MTPTEFRAIRKKLGLTQAQIAPCIGYKGLAKVSNMETGHRPIPWHVAQLMRCYDALGFTLDPHEARQQE